MGTIGSAGMSLYIDGSLVAAQAKPTASAQTYSGSWRVGYDSTGGWSSGPHSNFFGGAVAQASVYNYPLIAAQVAAHYGAATNPVSGLTIAETASVASTAPGNVVTYTITVTNTGAIPLTAANFTDSLTGVLDDASSDKDASATAGTVSYSSPSLSWTGALTVGASAVITYSVTVSNPATGDKSMVNTVTSTTAGSNCPAGNTDPRFAVTIPVVTGLLSITVPASATLSPAAPGAIAKGSLGNITVTDNRALANAGWTATVAASGFIAGPAPAIPAADAVYGINGFVFTTSNATFTSTPVTRLSATAQVVVTAARASGTNSATWNPAITVSVPASAVGGVYTASLSSSVS